MEKLLYKKNKQTPVIIDNASTPPPIAKGENKLVAKKRYVQAKLVTANQIAAELARVYRAMKSGDMDAGLGTKLTYVLSTLSKILADSKLEDRVAALEERSY